MISFRTGAFRFHYRAGAVVIDEGCVFLHRLEGDEFWAVPGGRVNAGETATQALNREFLEELGVEVECKELLASGENFFSYAGEPHHEIGLYFSAALPLGSPLLRKDGLHLGAEGSRRLEFRWFRLTELAEIDFRPAELCRALSSGTALNHFVQRV